MRCETLRSDPEGLVLEDHSGNFQIDPMTVMQSLFLYR